MFGSLDIRGGAVMVGRPPGPTRDGNDYAHWIPAGTSTRSACGVSCSPADSHYLRGLQACPQCDRHERGFSHRATETPAGRGDTPKSPLPAGHHYPHSGRHRTRS